MYWTDEAMDEFAQFAHDSMWETPEAIEPEVIREGDIADCVHDGAPITYYESNGEVYFRVWECPECGNVGEVGKEN